MPQRSTRDKLVESGFRVLYSKGFNGCSIQDITDAAGVPKGSFYNHFDSKERMALEALDVYVGLARLDMLQDETKRPLVRLRDHFEFLAAVYRKNATHLGCLAGNFASELSGSSPAVRSALVERFDGWNQAVAEVWRQAQAEGSVDADKDPEQLGRFTVAAWEGCLLSMKLNRSLQPVDDFFAIVFAFAGERAAPMRKRKR